MLTKFRIEFKYGLITLFLIEALVVLDRFQAFRGLDHVVADFFHLVAQLGVVGMFIVALVGNASLLLQAPYTVPLLSLALGGASLNNLLLMGLAAGFGAACGEMVSYSLTLKLFGGNPNLENSALLQWVKRTVDSHPRTAPVLLFIWAVSPLPDDTVIIPLAMVRYSIKQIALPLMTGKIVHNLAVAALFYYFTDLSAERVSTAVQVDLALGILIMFVMVILYQVEKVSAIKQVLVAEGSH